MRKTHGLAQHRTPEYCIWIGMRNRCRDKSDKDYGGRGIRVCERWNQFENFLADMGKRPSPQHSIDRIKVNRHYTPSNCKWSTPVEQANNQRRHAKPGMFSIKQLAIAFDLSARVLCRRLRRGMSLHDALTLPLKHRRNNLLLHYNGQTRPLTEWAEMLGLQKNTLHWRIVNGWTAEKALTTPLRPYPPPTKQFR